MIYDILPEDTFFHLWRFFLYDALVHSWFEFSWITLLFKTFFFFQKTAQCPYSSGCESTKLICLQPCFKSDAGCLFWWELLLLLRQDSEESSKTKSKQGGCPPIPAWRLPFCQVFLLPSLPVRHESGHETCTTGCCTCCTCHYIYMKPLHLSREMLGVYSEESSSSSKQGGCPSLLGGLPFCNLQFAISVIYWMWVV